MTSSPASRARPATRSSDACPGTPRRSKQATCGLIATATPATASITCAQCAVTASAARSAGVPRDRSPTATASGHSRCGSGSRPRTSWDSRSATRTASRSAKWAPPGWPPMGCCSPPREWLALDGLLEAGPGREARDLGGRDLDRLARARVDALAGAALGDAELAEPGEGDLTAAAEGLLDDGQHGINSLAGGALVEVALLGDVVDELGLGHCGPPSRVVVVSTLSAFSDD